MTCTFAATLWPVTPKNAAYRAIVLAVLGSALLYVCSKVYVPLPPVPISMQTYAVLLLGIAYGARLAALTILLFIGQGLVGLPVFAGPEPGLAVLVGPTAGYIYGWVAAATLVGWLSDRGWNRSFGWVLAGMALGNVVIYLVGLPWLSFYVPEGKTLALGLYPFTLGDALKLLLAALTVPLVWRLTGVRRRRT